MRLHKNIAPAVLSLCLIGGVQLSETFAEYQIPDNIEETQEVVKELSPVAIEIQGLGVSTSSINLGTLEEQEAKRQHELAVAEAERQHNEEMLLCLNAPPNVPDYLEGCNSKNITFMSYRLVTSKSSDQYKLLNSPECYTDPTYGIRMVGDRYCIAVGSGYCSEIGTKIDLVMKNGSIVKCILGDQKSDCHTDSTHRYHARDKSVAELVIDTDVWNKDNYPPEILGGIEKVVVIP